MTDIVNEPISGRVSGGVGVGGVPIVIIRVCESNHLPVWPVPKEFETVRRVSRLASERVTGLPKSSGPLVETSNETVIVSPVP